MREFPKFNEFMFPALKIGEKLGNFTQKDVRDFSAEYFNFSDDELDLRLQSNNQTLLASRVNWAIMYLKGIGDAKSKDFPLEQIGRNLYKLTNFGKILAKDENKLNDWFCNIYRKKLKTTQNKELSNSLHDIEILTPDENLNESVEKINNEVKAELIRMILQKEPKFFENLAVELLKKMGYGADGSATQLSRDGGIDGIISEDKLGLSKIYIQAKRFANGLVGVKDLREFGGVVSSTKSRKGVFITTSNFTKEAHEYANNHQGCSIALIDGERLAQLMLDYEIGVEVREIKKIYKINSDFFDEEF
ncbi:MAG: restriction endonuclease [Campylobacter sp.]|nr:restriction endonuclease [Campylobacter sp.]